MPKYGGDVDMVFRALADGTRRGMIERLARGPASVSALADPFDMAMPSVLQHLGILQDAGIVQSEKSGRVRTVQLIPGALEGANEWMSRQRTPAERQADRLGSYLTSAHEEPSRQGSTP